MTLGRCTLAGGAVSPQLSINCMTNKLSSFLMVASYSLTCPGDQIEINISFVMFVFFGRSRPIRY